MAPSRSARPRLIVGAGAVAAAMATAVVPLLDAGRLAPLVQGLAALAVATAVVGVTAALPASGALTAALLGAELVATLHDRGAALDPRTPAVAAGLLLVAELITWAAELRTAGSVVPGGAPRGLVVGASVVVAYAAALALGTLADLPFGRDLVVAAVGAGAIALVAAVLLHLARSRSTGTIR